MSPAGRRSGHRAAARLSRRSRRAAATLLALAAGAALAGEEDPPSAPLAEEEVLAAAPVLSAELRDLRAAAGLVRRFEQAASRELEDRKEAADAVQAGRVDPLAWSRERYPRLPLPEGWRYSAPCSREATASHGLFAVVVILTSGVDSPDYAPERMSRLGQEEVLRMKLEDAFLTDATRKRLRAAAGFFGSRGLLVGWELGYPTFESRDGRLSGAVHDHNELCREMPTGPYVELSVGPEPAPQAPEAPAALDAALRAARLTEEQYRGIVYRLTRARHFAEHPESLATAGGGRADRRNAELYSRLRGKLEPQLGELIRAQGGGR